MTKARERQVNYDATTKYLITCRCVRRAFLCGKDKLTKKDYDHRRGWMEDILLKLPTIFAIEIAAYAIMSNHYHLVINVNPDKAKSWSKTEVIKRWHDLYNGTTISKAFIKNETLSEQENIVLDESVEIWRERLINIGWFMKKINEPMARLANIEDDCTGKFWEARYKSKAILDDEALLSCMVYVDLNPLRAQMADTPEQSEYTSIKKRCASFKKSKASNLVEDQPKELLFLSKFSKNHIQMNADSYLELVDWTARQVREGKKGILDTQCPDILTRIDLEPESFFDTAKNVNHYFTNIIGKASSIDEHFKKFGLKRACGWIEGLRSLGF